MSNLRSYKELTYQFVSVLSNGEGLSAIWASLNFWFHVEEERDFFLIFLAGPQEVRVGQVGLYRCIYLPMKS